MSLAQIGYLSHPVHQIKFDHQELNHGWGLSTEPKELECVNHRRFSLCEIRILAIEIIVNLKLACSQSFTPQNRMNLSINSCYLEHLFENTYFGYI